MTWRRTETIQIYVPEAPTTQRLQQRLATMRQQSAAAQAVVDALPQSPVAPMAPQLPTGQVPMLPSAPAAEQPAMVQGQDGRTYVIQAITPAGGTPHVYAQPRRTPVLPFILIALVVVLLIVATPGTRAMLGGAGTTPLAASLSGAVPGEGAGDAGAFNPPGDGQLRGAPSVTPEQINHILAEYGSPAEGQGQVIYDLGVEWGIDPAWAVAFFIHESTAGTHPNWAGWKGNGSHTSNPGNIICAGYHRCHGRFRDYASWQEGFNDWYRLIHDEYLVGRGHNTVADIIPVYAPSADNNHPPSYINAVQALVDTWRNEHNKHGAQEPVSNGGDPVVPHGNPLRAANTVITQGYAIGTHAPAGTWGAIDLALDGNGDGRADPAGTQGRPIYATHAGVVEVTPESWPAGNHVWVTNAEYRTGYAHLASFTVASGQHIEAGTQIGTIGSTGMSSGPHLDYQVWKKEPNGWVNQNPLDYGILEA